MAMRYRACHELRRRRPLGRVCDGEIWPINHARILMGTAQRRRTEKWQEEKCTGYKSGVGENTGFRRLCLRLCSDAVRDHWQALDCGSRVSAAPSRSPSPVSSPSM